MNDSKHAILHLMNEYWRRRAGRRSGSARPRRGRGNDVGEAASHSGDHPGATGYALSQVVDVDSGPQVFSQSRVDENPQAFVEPFHKNVECGAITVLGPVDKVLC